MIKMENNRNRHYGKFYEVHDMTLLFGGNQPQHSVVRSRLIQEPGYQHGAHHGLGNGYIDNLTDSQHALIRDFFNMQGTAHAAILSIRGPNLEANRARLLPDINRLRGNVQDVVCDFEQKGDETICTVMKQ